MASAFSFHAINSVCSDLNRRGIFLPELEQLLVSLLYLLVHGLVFDLELLEVNQMKPDGSPASRMCQSHLKKLAANTIGPFFTVSPWAGLGMVVPMSTNKQMVKLELIRTTQSETARIWRSLTLPRVALSLEGFPPPFSASCAG